jgi:RNA polymerase sigma factor (sigma-70 family)
VTLSPVGEDRPWAHLSRADLEQRFATLLAAHGPALGRLAGSYTRESGERDDLFQEIAVAVWKALPRFRGECSERTFLFRIAHNRAITYLARRRLPTVEADQELEVEDAAPDPEQALSSEQQGDRLLAAIRRLPVAYAQVVTLTLEGLSYADVADVLGITESNVGARLTRARQMLRTFLKDSHGT